MIKDNPFIAQYNYDAALAAQVASLQQLKKECIPSVNTQFYTDKTLLHTVRDLVNALETAIDVLGVDRLDALAAFKAKVAQLEA